MRNAFGAAWGQTALPATRLDTPGAEAWTGELNRYLAVGANARAGYAYTDVPNQRAPSEFDIEEMRAYLGVSLIPERVLLYVDQRIAPGGSTNLEAMRATRRRTSAGRSKRDSLSARAEHVRAAWRVGASANFNDANAGERTMAGVFAGVRTGPVAWLAEADYIDDESFAGGRTLWAGLLEANWMFRKGRNLKTTVEYFEPDDEVDEDDQSRASIVWE